MCWQAACLARCNGAKVEVKQSGSFSIEEFREDVRRAARSGSEHLIVSYSRKQFQQTGEWVVFHTIRAMQFKMVSCHPSMYLVLIAGDGHFSPLGGYHEGRDLVLILDTARFKYPPVR